VIQMRIYCMRSIPCVWRSGMKIDKYNILLSRSVGRNLLFGLIPVIVSVALVVGSINIFLTRRREERILQEQANEIVENLARILTWSLYLSAYDDTIIIGNEYRKIPNVVSIRIFDEKHKMIYNMGSGSQDRSLLVKKPITAFNRRIGFVEVAFTTKSIFRQQREFLYYTILITFCTIMAVIIALIVLLEILIGKPFSALIDGVSAIAAGSYEHKLAPVKDRYMNLIGQSVNAMAENIAARERHFKQLVEKRKQH
jgi:methyl-accepting chemotaxis protein